MECSDLIIYGTLFGNYDEPPKIKHPISGCRYYLVTDSDKNFDSYHPWNIIKRPIVMGCPKRTTSLYKCDPTSIFGNQKVIYIDCNLTPTESFNATVVNQIMGMGNFVLGIHPDRTSGRAELLHCVNSGYIDISVMRKYMGFIDSLGWSKTDIWLAHTSLHYRDLSIPEVVQAGKLWATLCAFGPVRDQISVTIALEQANCKHALIQNFEVWLKKNFIRSKHKDNRKALGYGSF